MPIPTRETLKAYFETGDKPTQAQFAELIDAIYDLNQQTADNATAVAPVALLYSTFDGAAWTIQRSANVSAVTPISTTTTERVTRITFTAALADVNYVVSGSGNKTIHTTTALVLNSPSGSGSSNAVITATASFCVRARTTGYVDIVLPLSATEISIAVYLP